MICIFLAPKTMRKLHLYSMENLKRNMCVSKLKKLSLCVLQNTITFIISISTVLISQITARNIRFDKYYLNALDMNC